VANRLTAAIVGAGRKIAAGARWLITHEPALTAAVAGAVGNAVYAGLNDDLTSDQLFRSACLAALGVLVRMKVSSPATTAALTRDNDNLRQWAFDVEAHREQLVGRLAVVEGERDTLAAALGGARIDELKAELHTVKNDLHRARLLHADALDELARNGIGLIQGDPLPPPAPDA